MKDFEFQKAKHPFTLIIFGASGSLAQLKLFPALYELAQEKRMPKDFKIVGYARTPMSTEKFRKQFAYSVKKYVEHVDLKVLDALLKNVSYFTGAYDNADDYKKFKNHLKEIENFKSGVRMAYFSVPPSAFDSIFLNLGKTNFDTRFSQLRLIIEKPFGTNLKSAKRLQRILLRHFEEKQIFLLDHYLGKEAVSNLLSLRLANPILNTLLEKNNVANIQIHAMENVDIEGRANYFDHVGVVRDMVQSHLLQILTYLTMNLPKEKTAEAIRKEKIKILKSAQIKSVTDEVVRGQYQGYRKEKGIAPMSQAETFVALKMRLKHPDWKNVPIYFRTGKALKSKWTAVVIEFKPQDIQKHYGIKQMNRLVIQLQPTEKIEFHLLTKLGGKTFDFHELTTGRPIYCSGDCVSEHGRLLLDVIENKKGLFLSFEEILAAWKVIDPIEKLCSKMRSKCTLLHVYPKGSLGPKAADHLIQKEGFEWFYSLPKQ